MKQKKNIFKWYLNLFILSTLLISGVLIPQTKVRAESDNTWDISASNSSVTAKLEDGILTISGSGKTLDYEPTGANGKSKPIWNNNTDITKVVIEDGVNGIGQYVFYGMKGVTEIILPKNNIIDLGLMCFAYTTSLEEIDLTKARTCSNKLFYGSSSLKTIKVPVDPYASYGLGTSGTFTTGVKNQVIDYIFPEGITKINDYMFFQCDNIIEANIPETVTVIGRNAYNSSSVKAITIPEGVTKINDYAFANIGKAETPIVDVIIPETVQSIGMYSFYYNYIINLWFYNPLTQIYSSSDTIRGTSFIHGYASSTAQAYAGKLFVEIEPVGPKIANQTLSYDKYTKSDVVATVSLGLSDLKASSILSVKINDIEIDNSLWNLSGTTKLVLDKDIFDNFEEGAQKVITVIFDDFANTTLSNIKVKIIDNSPIKHPSIKIISPTYDRVNPTEIKWVYDMGTEGTLLTIKVNESEVNANNYVIDNKNKTVTFNQDYLDSLSNDNYKVEFIFNDTANTIYEDTLTVTGVIAVLPEIIIQSIKYNKTDISFQIAYGNIATSITDVKVNNSSLPKAYYNINGTTLTISDDYLSVLNNGLYVVDLVYNDNTIIGSMLSFSVPKDTSSVTPTNSVLNILYINGSTYDLTIPITGNPTSVSSLYIDSTLVDISNYTYNSMSKVLTIKASFLNSLNSGSHSMIIGLDYTNNIIVYPQTSSESTQTHNTNRSANSDIGVVLSKIDGLGTSGLTYYINEKGEAIINGYNGNDSDVTIPDTIDGVPVRGIDSLDGEGKDKIININIPENVISITPGSIAVTVKITAPSGSTGEAYAKGNGNSFSSSEGNYVVPTVTKQTVKFNLDTPADITINGVAVNSAKSVAYIRVNDIRVNSDWTNDGGLVLTKQAFTLSNNGILTISKDYLGKIGLSPNQTLPIQIGFADGNLDVNNVTLEVIGTPKDYSDNLQIDISKSGVVGTKFTLQSAKAGQTYYSSSDNNIAYVDNAGKVTLKKIGTAIITINNTDRNIVKNVRINVTKTPKKATDIASTRTACLKDSFTIKLDSAKYSTSNKKIITIDKNGKLKFKKTGTATIKVTETTDNVKIVYSTKIKVVKADVKRTGVTGSKFTLTSVSKGKTTYSTSDKNVATVTKKGKVTLKESGSAVITMKTKVDGKTITKILKITVIDKQKKSTDIINKKSLKVKKNYTIKVTNGKYTTSKKKIVSVNNKGKFTAKKVGKATLTVTETVSDVKIKYSINMTVTKK